MHRILVIFMLIISVNVFAEEGVNTSDETSGFIWPVKNALPGDNVILSPSDQILNSFLDTCQNYDGFIIGGNFGDPVVAVSDGTVIFFNYNYSDKYLYSYSFNTAEEADDFMKEREPADRKWINYFVGIKTDKGETIWYTGLNINDSIVLSTGEHVKRGDVIGSVGYSYRFIEEPSITISCDEHGRPADIQKKLLGSAHQGPDLKENENRKNYRTLKHSADELKNDLQIMKTSLEELHPALYAYTSAEEFDEIYAVVGAELDKPLTSDQFFRKINPIIQAVRDNHTYLRRDYFSNFNYRYEPHSYFPVKLTVVDNKCYILDDPIHSVPAGAEIEYINGESVDVILEKIRKLMTIASGNISGWQEELLKSSFGEYYILENELEAGDSVRIGFGDEFEEIYILQEERPGPETARDASGKRPYSISELQDNIILFRIGSMSLTEKDRSDIGSFFENLHSRKSVIIDLRSNMGGNIIDTYFVYSLFAEHSFIPETEKKVNNNGLYSALKYSLNYSNREALYPEYTPRDGEEGFFYSYEEHPAKFRLIEPVPDRFKGRVYVLTDGLTGSAAVQLAAYFRYFGRGTVIGAEGCGNFYSMNAVDFALIRLGETGIILNIPMVKTSTGFRPVAGIPEDRGVIPDYLVTDSIDDILAGRDGVLSFTLELAKKQAVKKRIVIIAVCFSVLLLSLIVLFFGIKKVNAESRPNI